MHYTRKPWFVRGADRWETAKRTQHSTTILSRSDAACQAASWLVEKDSRRGWLFDPSKNHPDPQQIGKGRVAPARTVPRVFEVNQHLVHNVPMVQRLLVLGRRSAHIALSPRPGDVLCKVRPCMGRPRDGGCERFLRRMSDMHVQLICFENPPSRSFALHARLC
jgi:hypothetical protein